MPPKTLFVLFCVLLIARTVAEALVNPRLKTDSPLKKDESLSLAALTLAHVLSALAVAAVLFMRGNTSSLLFAMGCLLFISGAAGRLTALRQLGASYSQRIDPLRGSTLVTSGLYGVVRHPLYLFYVVEMAGLLLVGPNWVSVAMLAVVGAATAYRVAAEERQLGTKFGEAHQAYRRRTKMFIPYIW